jgi:iron complex outermembrane receptor protein
MPPFAAATLHAVAAIAAMALGAAQAQTASPQRIVITGAVEGRALDAAPFAASVVEREVLDAAGPMVNLSEAMARVPGLVVTNRHNFAQDLQISSRGFGARAGFGVRGIRLYADGIPASGPDGQGQVSHFDIAGADRVEVLRGPFSVLYGNGSGGVIALYTEPVRDEALEGALDVGSFGLRQARAAAQGRFGERAFARIGVQALRSDGFRPQSRARRELATLRAGWASADEADRITLRASHLEQPAQDPLGLTPAQFAADPRQTTPQALQFDTRKDTSHGQLGAHWRHRFGAGGDASSLRDVQLAAWGGRRSVTQWLAIPATTQAAPRHGGGVIDFDRDFAGLDARLRWDVGAARFVAGVALDDQRDARRGYENFVGSTLGVTGNLRRDETQTARSRDAYAQAEWPLGAGGGLLSAGVRHTRVRLAAHDRFLSNGDDSGRRDFSATMPVLGVRWPLNAAARAAESSREGGLTLHASLGRGFESPTLGELAYRPDGSGGFNTTLEGQASRQVEAGLRWRAATLAVDATLFDARTEDEIAVASNSGGRQSFRNVGRTQRRGAELQATWRPAPAWSFAAAATWLDARYRDGFLVCAAAPCSTPNVPVEAGGRIAGTQRAQAFVDAEWRSAWLGRVGLELRAADRLIADDRNSAWAPGHGVVGLRWLRDWPAAGGVQLQALLRVDNVFDKAYAGSVIVNEGNGRVLEPGAPRSVLLALRVTFKP